MDGALDAGSYRDPAGSVYVLDGRVFRTVNARAADDYRYLRDRGLLDRWARKAWIVDSKEVEPTALGALGMTATYVLEHSALPFISYPYEWPFPALKAAALLHLDLQLSALAEGVSLSDASAYNVQFIGPQPIFIDILSFRRYREGEFWTGHRQFCEQFLNPLLLRALLGVPHNAWFRGALEGISGLDLSRLLPWSRRLSWNVLTHVILPARWQRTAIDEGGTRTVERLRAKKLSRMAYQGLLTQLRDWIARLEPKDTGRTVWSNYAETHTYASDEEAAKRAFVAAFARQIRPQMLWDVGCNTGAYSEVALEAGADRVIGFDFDQGALEKAFARARSKALDLLPLFLDGANPSPNQGWNGVERKALGARASADAVLALAFLHHLAIGRNVPLDEGVSWLVGLAPCGVIEFVPKTDPTVQRMLALREDIFDHYSEEVFTAALEQRARVVKVEIVSAAGRRLFLYDRR